MQQFDAIVVGAGPAGSCAALAMARAGLQVALIERGEYPGRRMFPALLSMRPIFWWTCYLTFGKRLR